MTWNSDIVTAWTWVNPTVHVLHVLNVYYPLDWYLLMLKKFHVGLSKKKKKVLNWEMCSQRTVGPWPLLLLICIFHTQLWSDVGLFHHMFSPWRNSTDPNTGDSYSKVKASTNIVLFNKHKVPVTVKFVKPDCKIIRTVGFGEWWVTWFPFGQWSSGCWRKLHDNADMLCTIGLYQETCSDTKWHFLDIYHHKF